MDQVSPALSQLLESFSGCFRQEAFQTFRLMIAAWVVCPGPRTLSEVWQATGLAGRCHHDRAYSLFASARWSWDDLGRILLRLAVARLVPDGPVWLVVDDTLCHKRGAKVALGGFFLDPVASTRKRKTFRFGVNWVVLGLVVRLPFRPDRYVCLPILWRAYRKAGTPGHLKRTELAAEMARLAAGWLEGRPCWLAGDSAYVNAATLKGRPANLGVIGPLRPDAALYAPPPPRRPGQRGAPRKKGERLMTPAEAFANEATYPASEHEIDLPRGPKRVRTQVMAGVLWYTGSGEERVSVVLVRDPSGAWKDTALLVTSPSASVEFAVSGYCRRWSIEVAFRDSKQHLGLHDAHVRCEASVERAHPAAWFVASLTVVWYAGSGQDGERVQRERPWYAHKEDHTFADMLGALRLEQWRARIVGMSQSGQGDAEILDTLIHWSAAVR